MTGRNNSSGTRWSGLETRGMREARCSLLIQEDTAFDAKIKALPKQRVMVYQDKGFNPNGSGRDNMEDNFYVDFKGATILQLEPVLGGPHKSMPVTMTVGGRCVFTPENYEDFRVMMRSKEQSQQMGIAPNGNFDWPDVSSLLLCPVCGNMHPIPRKGDRKEHEYWMVFYPLLQISIMKGSQMTLGTRTVCRFVTLSCMEDLLEGLTLKMQPGKSSAGDVRKSSRLTFTLPAADVLAEAGSASFLEDGPPRPESHPHVDDVLDAWTLYNLWEHSGAWEALQNDYRVVLSRSMHADPAEIEALEKNPEPRLKERMGRSCGNSACGRVHGMPDPKSSSTNSGDVCARSNTHEICRLVIKCRKCHSEYYCSQQCREIAKDEHAEECERRQRDREERREKKSKRVQCVTCARRFAITKMKKCSRCRKATYCSVDCQRLDWERHKHECFSI